MANVVIDIEPDCPEYSYFDRKEKIEDVVVFGHPSKKSGNYRLIELTMDEETARKERVEWRKIRKSKSLQGYTPRLCKIDVSKDGSNKVQLIEKYTEVTPFLDFLRERRTDHLNEKTGTDIINSLYKGISILHEKGYAVEDLQEGDLLIHGSKPFLVGFGSLRDTTAELVKKNNETIATAIESVVRITKWSSEDTKKEAQRLVNELRGIHELHTPRIPPHVNTRRSVKPPEHVGKITVATHGGRRTRRRKGGRRRTYSRAL